MMYKFSSFREKIILTVTPDIRINSPNLYRTDLLSNQAVSPSISSIIFDLVSLSSLNFIGSWTIFQVAFKAKEHGKCVFLYNVQPSIQEALVNAGILNLASFIHTKEEFDTVLRGNHPSSAPTVSFRFTEEMKSALAERYADSTELTA